MIHPNHHWSLPFHSTSTALAQVFDFCLEAAENQQLSALCLIDQKAAYDILCHKILREKLQLYNFTESAVEWVMSYLGGRCQYVKVESKISEKMDCGDFGAPQGSVLAGLLHLIFSNDFPACHEEGQAVVFVDDDTDSVCDSDPESLKSKIQTEARKSAQWLKDNRMVVAADKSKLIVAGTPQLRSSKLTGENKMSIIVDDETIHESNSERLLGLVISNQLSWKDYLYGDEKNKGLVTKLNQRVGILKVLAKYMNPKTLKILQ